MLCDHHIGVENDIILGLHVQFHFNRQTQWQMESPESQASVLLGKCNSPHGTPRLSRKSVR